jgi:hypothetical protein
MAMVLIARSNLLLNVSWVRLMSVGCSFTFKKRKNSCRRVCKHLDDEFEQPIMNNSGGPHQSIVPVPQAPVLLAALLMYCHGMSHME